MAEDLNLAELNVALLQTVHDGAHRVIRRGGNLGDAELVGLCVDDGDVGERTADVDGYAEGLGIRRQEKVLAFHKSNGR